MRVALVGAVGRAAVVQVLMVKAVFPTVLWGVEVAVVECVEVWRRLDRQ